MIAIIFAIVATISVFRSAKQNGYNAVLWAVITVVVFIGGQLLFGLAIGIFIGIGSQLWGWSPTLVYDYQLLIGLVALIPSVIGVLLILRHVNKVRDDGFNAAPPPPPTFGGGQ